MPMQSKVKVLGHGNSASPCLEWSTETVSAPPTALLRAVWWPLHRIPY